MGGAEPKAEMLERICGFLGVDAKWLLFGSETVQSSVQSSVLREEPYPYRAGPPKTELEPEPTLADAFRLLKQALDVLEVIVRKESMK